MNKLVVRASVVPVAGAVVALALGWLSSELVGLVPAWMLPAVFQAPLTYNEYVTIAAVTLFPLALALMLV